MILYDGLTNLVTFGLTFNSHFVNRGTWVAFLPGAQMPGLQHHVMPLLLHPGFYIAFFGQAVLLCWVLDRLLAWRPGLSLMGGFFIIYWVVFAADLLLENASSVWSCWPTPPCPRIWHCSAALGTSSRCTNRSCSPASAWRS